MEKYLLFTTGGGAADPLNWDSSEAAVYKLGDFKGMKPKDARTLEMFFETSNGKEIVALGVKNGSHSLVMKAISSALVKSTQSIITVADVDQGLFVNNNIYSVKITAQETYMQKITDNKKTQISVPRGSYTSCLIANTDASAAVACTLHLTSQVGSDITDTGTNLNNGSGYAAGTTSSLTLDGTAATADIFLNEQVWKSDGTLFGVCTVFTDGTHITFGGGLEQAFVDDDDLYVGTRYILLNALSIPANTVLKLESDEISFDNVNYNLYVTSGDSDGQLTFIFNY